ncbi:MAG TPA: phosphate ABC transporter permease PtsA [Acidimicrobiaceae bacterium]|nr:phosphate ABC transporter permease PtsA [Acidimicrobiaceae bacterium]
MALTTPAAQVGAIVPEQVRRQLTGRRSDTAGRIFQAVLIGAVAASVAVLGVLVYDMVQTGSGTLTGRLGDFLTGSLRSQPGESGLLQGLRGTFYIGVFTVVFAFPIGVGAAIYLEEYASKSRLSRFIDLNIRNLAGVPSVVYGILGLAIFVKALGSFTGPSSQGRSLISAGLTLAILVLPIVIITASEALRAVPGSLREAGYGVGATRWEVTRDHVLPYAAPGILTGTVLALARAMGEAAPLILVGAVTGFLSGGTELDPTTLGDRFTAMPIIITTWAGRPGPEWEQATAAAIVVLLVVVLAANAVAILLRNHYEKKRG